MIKNEQARVYREVLPLAAIGAAALAILVGVEHPNQVHHAKEALGEAPFKPLPNNPPDQYLAGNFIVGLPKRIDIHKPRLVTTGQRH